MLFAAMTVMAYVATPYIKIGDNIYALTVSLSRPDPPDAHTAESDPAGAPDARKADPHFDPAPDSYSGLLTAATMWWMLVGLAVIAAVNAYAYLFSDGKPLVAAVGTGFLALLAIGTGYGDASWDYPIARGQRLQLGLASLITAGGFALVYLTAYYTARRRPLRRQQSLEYRAHPRHQKSEEIDYGDAWDFVDDDGKPYKLRFRRNRAPRNDPRLFDGTGQLIAVVADVSLPTTTPKSPSAGPT
jgi:hypothetical protein